MNFLGLLAQPQRLANYNKVKRSCHTQATGDPVQARAYEATESFASPSPPPHGRDAGLPQQLMSPVTICSPEGQRQC